MIWTTKVLRGFILSHTLKRRLSQVFVEREKGKKNFRKSEQRNGGTFASSVSNGRAKALRRNPWKFEGKSPAKVHDYQLVVVERTKSGSSIVIVRWTRFAAIEKLYCELIDRVSNEKKVDIRRTTIPNKTVIEINWGEKKKVLSTALESISIWDEFCYFFNSRSAPPNRARSLCTIKCRFTLANFSLAREVKEAKAIWGN